jgi:hypothetical protein
MKKTVGAISRAFIATLVCVFFTCFAHAEQSSTCRYNRPSEGVDFEYTTSHGSNFGILKYHITPDAGDFPYVGDMRLEYSHEDDGYHVFHGDNDNISAKLNVSAEGGFGFVFLDFTIYTGGPIPSIFGGALSCSTSR